MTAANQSSVVITGASRGVGQAIALAFAQRGWTLALVARDVAHLNETAAQVRSRGAQALCFMADLASREQVSRLASDIRSALGSISVLVHSAGVFVEGAVQSSPPDEFDRALEVNLRAPYFLTQQLISALVAGRGHIIFINSSVVGQRRANLAAYAASKQALVAVADSLRQEVNPLGIRVLTVFLGATATAMQEQIYASEARPYRPEELLQPDDVATLIQCAVTLPPSAEVTDLHIRPSAGHRGR